MKNLAILAFITLSACATPAADEDRSRQAATPVAQSGDPTTSASPRTIPDNVAISGTRGLLLANYIYQSLGTPVAVAIERGVIAGPLKANVQAVDRQVIAALEAGRATQDVSMKARHAAEALRLLDRISALTGIPIPTL